MATFNDMPVMIMADTSTNSSFDTDLFRTTVEDHLVLLRNSPTAYTFEASPIDGLVYTGDLYGLFKKNNVDKHLLWTTMRMNGYTNPTEYDGERLVFLVPNIDVLTRIAAAVSSRQKLQLK